MNETLKKIKTWIGKTLMDYTYALCQLSNRNGLGRLLRRCHKLVLSMLNISFLPVESAISYKDKFNNCHISPILVNRKGYTAAPSFGIDELGVNLDERPLPDVNLYRFNDVLILGDSDMIVDRTNGCVINDFCYNLDPDVLFVDGLLYQLKSNVCILRSNLKWVSHTLQSGIMLNGKFSRNYYHELLENLIKLVVLKDLTIPVDVPIIVDETVKKIPAFDFVFKQLTLEQHREVVYLKSGEMMLVHDLYAISYVNRITPHIIGRSIAKDDIVFDVDLLKQFKKQLLVWKSNKDFPRRIFLTRKNATHRTFNEEDMQKVLEPLGFVAVAPEEYPFQDQMALFNQAEFVVGGTGAAFTNLLFSKENCKALCIRPNVDGTPTVFTVLANMNHCLLSYYRSDEKRSDDNIHSNFYVDPKRFEEHLNRFMSYEK